MKKLSQIINNNSSSAIAQMNHIYKIWYDTIMENLKAITTPYSFDPFTKTLVIKVHDNIWFTDLSFMTDDFKQKLNTNGLEISTLIFKYSPKYEKMKQNTQNLYEISKKCQNYIENSIKKIDNEKLAKYFREYLINYFKHNNFEDWITK